MNVIIDDMMIIYYNETEDEVHRNLIREMRRSPYRNYVKSEEFHENDVVIRPEDTNKVVQELKKQYEPVFGFCRREQDDVGKSKGGRAFRSFCRPGK